MNDQKSTNYEDLIAVGYSVARSRSKPENFRWWLNTENDGKSLPVRDCSEQSFVTEADAWSDALRDALASSVLAGAHGNQQETTALVAREEYHPYVVEVKVGESVPFCPFDTNFSTLLEAEGAAILYLNSEADANEARIFQYTDDTDTPQIKEVKCIGRAEALAKKVLELPNHNSLDHEFKNFHRQLCERFDYAHDEIDWKRDQLSLIEWIAERIKSFKQQRDALFNAITLIAAQSVSDDWTVEQAFSFVRQHARETRNAARTGALGSALASQDHDYATLFSSERSRANEERARAERLEEAVADAREAVDRLRQALEVIGAGDAADPQAAAKDALEAAGIWMVGGTGSSGESR